MIRRGNELFFRLERGAWRQSQWARPDVVSRKTIFLRNSLLVTGFSHIILPLKNPVLPMRLSKFSAKRARKRFGADDGSAALDMALYCLADASTGFLGRGSKSLGIWRPGRAAHRRKRAAVSRLTTIKPFNLYTPPRFCAKQTA